MARALLCSYNGINTSHLLEDHEHNRDDGSVAVSGDQHHLLEKSLERRVASQASLSLELLRHLSKLSGNVIGIGRHSIFLVSYTRRDFLVTS